MIYEALLVAIGTFVIGMRMRQRLFPFLFNLTGENITSVDDVIMKVLLTLGPWFYAITGVWLGSRLLEIPELADQILMAIYYIVVIRQLSQGMIDVLLEYLKKAYFEGKNTHHYTLLKGVLNTALWTVIILLVLSNIGVQITPLIASLGVLGIAISFGLQNILEDLFSSISIYIDQPFRIGDYIDVMGEGGIVNYVGLKTTRITTTVGEELVMSNRNLTSSTIHNFGKVEKRTITHTFIISHDTPLKHHTLIPDLVEQHCEFSDIIDLQWCHLTATDLQGVHYTMRYSILQGDYQTHLQLQTKILTSMLKSFEENKISLARGIGVQ